MSLRMTALLIVAATLAGCGSRGARPEFYTLSAASTAAVSPVASRPELGLAVGPIELPRYLDRTQIVTRDGSHRLIVTDAHRWGGSLRTDVLRVVSDDLARLLGTSRVATYPAEPRFAADYRVLLDFGELEGTLGGTAVLRVRWTIVSVADGRAVAVEETRLERPTASPSVEDLVAAESALLGEVTRQVAERLASFPPR